MKIYNIADNREDGLGKHSDSRGQITDIFYGRNINHACLITNAPGAIRGNHYHKETTQFTYVLSGTLSYYSQPVSGGPIVRTDCVSGDFVISPPNEIHAMQAGPQGCVFIAFAEGPRGGEDYEKDTYRVDSIIL